MIFLIINDDLQKAAEILKQIAITARMKTSNNEVNDFVQKWEDIEQ